MANLFGMGYPPYRTDIMKEYFVMWHLQMKKIMGLAVLLVAVHACKEGTKVNKENRGEMCFQKTIDLQLDTVLHSSIIDFLPVGDSSYILTDGIGIYRISDTGRITKRVCNQGHAKGEYLKIGKLYSNGKNIYAWCSSSLQLYKYDMNLNFEEVYSGLHHAIAKFTVSSRDTAYFLLSGGSDEVVATLPLTQGGKASYGDSYTNEDKALLFNAASGGIAVLGDQVKYVKPSEMRVCNVGNSDRRLYEDEDFHVSPITDKLATLPQDKVLNYVLSNSTCTGLYADGNCLWLIAETGPVLWDQDGSLVYDDRKLNFYKIDHKGNLLASCMFCYPTNAVAYSVCQNCVHLLFDEGGSYRIKVQPL